MAKTGGVADYNTFVQGLITEASPLTYPENASLDEENFELRRDGSRIRRLGVDYEQLEDYQLFWQNYGITGLAFMSYEWLGAGGRGEHDFAVVQTGRYVHFYGMYTASISQGYKTSILIDLEDFKAPETGESEVARAPISVGQVKGSLLITSEAIEPIIVSYEPESETMTTEKIEIRIRDFIGLQDGLETDHRPTAGDNTSEHLYNLYNQGWNETNITSFFTAESVYPSNSDIMHLGKDSTDTFVAAWLKKQFFGNTPAPRGKFTYNIFNREYKNYEYNAQFNIASISYVASSGQMVITTATNHGLSAGDTFKLSGVQITLTWDEAYDSDTPGSLVSRTRRVDGTSDDTLNNKTWTVQSSTPSTVTITWQTDIDDDSNRIFGWNAKQSKQLSFTNGKIKTYDTADVIETKVENRRFQSIAGYASRVWYGGINGGEWANHIFYSQIVERPDQVGLCYQEADPTSEHQSDLVDTDGGTIVIPEMDRCVALVPMGNSLFVFAENGVWKVSGIEGTFTATSYRVDKVSSVGVWGQHTIIPVENMIFYWAKGGIYSLSPSDVTNEYSAQNISETSIQTLFNNYPAESKPYVKGHYDPAAKTIEWLIMTDGDYARDMADRLVTPYNYNEILKFDLVLNAWYKYTLPTNTDNTSGTFIAGVFRTSDVLSREVATNVVAGANNVVSQTTNNVIVSSKYDRTGLTQTKYLALGYQPIQSTGLFAWYMTFAEFNNYSFRDWEKYDGIGHNYKSYLITGYDLMGSQSNKKQSHYLLAYFKRTEGNIVGGEADQASSCFVRAQWDWATSANSGKWGTLFQAYRIPRHWYSAEPFDGYDYGADVLVSKSKLRGRGRSLSLYIESEAGKDMKLLGWSIVATGMQKP
jgi:hypothetical protein